MGITILSPVQSGELHMVCRYCRHGFSKNRYLHSILILRIFVIILKVFILFMNIFNFTNFFPRKTANGRPRMMTSFSVSIADTVFTIVVEIIFLVQGKLFSMCVPINGVSKLINVFHMCLLNALYCFEYKWYNQGLELHKRLSSIETHWPYFLGNIDFFFFVKSKKKYENQFSSIKLYCSK